MEFKYKKEYEKIISRFNPMASSCAYDFMDAVERKICKEYINFMIAESERKAYENLYNKKRKEL